MASSTHNYQVTQPGRFRRSRPSPVVIRSAQYEPTGDMVILKLGRFGPRKPLNLTIKGLVWAGVPATTIATSLRPRPR